MNREQPRGPGHTDGNADDSMTGDKKTALGHLYASFQSRQTASRRQEASKGAATRSNAIDDLDDDETLFEATQQPVAQDSSDTKVIWAASPSDMMLKSVLSDQSQRLNRGSPLVSDRQVRVAA